MKIHTPKRSAVCPGHPPAVMGRHRTKAVDACVGTSRMSVFGQRDVHLWQGVAPAIVGLAGVQFAGQAPGRSPSREELVRPPEPRRPSGGRILSSWGTPAFPSEPSTDCMRPPCIREGICLSQVCGFKCESLLTSMFTASVDWCWREYPALGPSHVDAPNEPPQPPVPKPDREGTQWPGPWRPALLPG